MLSPTFGPADSTTPSGPRTAPQQLTTLKIVIAGGFGVGKTTAVGAVSEITPLRTEEYLTESSVLVDSLDGIEAKTTTTVAFDFGRAHPPRRPRALGDVPLRRARPGPLPRTVARPRPRGDRRRGPGRHTSPGDQLHRRQLLRGQRPAVRRGEQRVRRRPRFRAEQIRAALDLDPHVPVLTCDARNPSHVAAALITLVQHALHTAPDHTGLRRNTFQDAR